ncbi:MAG: PaaI family thioesterase [Alphaproteobacteria bacterium]
MSTPLYERGNFAELIDYRLTAWTENEAEISFEAEARHMNRSGLLHGGVLATVIDAACGFAGCYEPPPSQGRRVLTLSLTTQYIGPVPAGTQLTTTATRSGGGRTIFFASCEVRDAEGRLVATGSGTFKYRS